MEELERRWTEESRNDDAIYGTNQRAGRGATEFHGINVRWESRDQRN